jgi:hypothetical protein
MSQIEPGSHPEACGGSGAGGRGGGAQSIRSWWAAVFFKFCFCGPVGGGGGDAHALPFVVGRTLVEADRVCAT